MKTHDEAAAIVNISPRLVVHAIRVIKLGCEELIAAVESGRLAVSTASVLTALPREEQAQVMAGGARQAAHKAWEIRNGDIDAAVPRPSPGRFGVFEIERAAENANSGRVFLWLAAGALPKAVAAMKAWGFKYAGTE